MIKVIVSANGTITKLGVREQRAVALCDWIKELEGDAHISMEWAKSKMYGMNPKIEWNGGACTDISGCGYDKESACLAQALRWIGKDEDENRAIHMTGGAGFYSVQKALEAAGWKIERTATGKMFDAFSIKRA